MSRAQVQNASSGKQVRRAGRSEKFAARLLAVDTAAVMATPEGRRFVWWLLGECRTFESVLRDGEERALYNAGKQDIGHRLMAHVIATVPDHYLLMQNEAIAAQRLVESTLPEEPTTEDGGVMLSEPPEPTDD